ncbi:hypothetical protein BGP_0636 [Beggiatoa sp. PS]|nr:hypothetical protein BGP_0636 [Beggiatoa sp. PS]
MQSLWTTDKKEDQEKITGQEDVITQWTYYLEQYKTNQSESKNYENWQTVMQLAPVTIFADHLATWAQQGQIEQLTIISGPLGQLPWESLSSLENLLAREISVAHWQAMKAPPPLASPLSL